MRGPARRRYIPEGLASIPGPGTTVDTFAAEVADYLQRTPRQLPSKYFYDPLGSSLFDAICRLPWYRVTRAESGLLARHGTEMLAPFDEPFALAELGCGNGEKLALLVACAAAPCREVHLIDISLAALRLARERLSGAAGAVAAHHGTYEEGLAQVAARRGRGPLMVLFLGSNIGNFDPAPARQLLRAIRRCLAPGDALLLGSDLIKPERDLLLAYDDPLQVTAAFNRNLLRRINDELGGTFALDGFAHRAVWNAAESRVEMHLVSRRPQVVRVSAAGLVIGFEAGDWIWTESSYKYRREAVVEEGLAAGFSGAVQWIDEEAQFAVTRFTV